MPTVSDAPQTALAHWLRLLWNRAPGLHLDSEAPYIAGGALFLPAQTDWHDHRAAAAHAAAHLVYSPARFDGEALVPIARTLLALLEDARVEALAMRELPGLARLWRPLHTATPDSGNGCEPLMNRLARALADPVYVDDHPWVAKGRRLFYLDEDLGLPALQTPAALRDAAMRLGHDLGQMRVPFNAKGYRPTPAYRDDHRWMWAADRLADEQPPPQPRPTPADALQQAGEPEATGPEQISHQPEWDRLIRRLRPDWCRVIEQAAPRTDPSPPRTADRAAADTRERSRRLLGPLRQWARPPVPRGRSADGEAFDLDALVDWSSARRSGLPPDARVYRASQRQAAHAGAWLLVDRSASTAAAMGDAAGNGSGTGSVLQAAARSAAATALALQALGVPCAVAAFSSNGRQAVRLVMVQAFGHGGGSGDLAARLQALRPAGSTRLGAALRHATARLGTGRRDGARWVLLISDGQPHDVDVHDPRYLVDDARHAVHGARRRGVRMACLSVGAVATPAALRIFGRHGAQRLPDLDSLPQALRRLMA